MLKILGPLAILGLMVPVAAVAQGPEPLEVGIEAPDFELEGATRFGVLRDAVRLSEFRGKTVVLAFFYRVRTPG
ncbi:hypothetical protein ACFL5T_02905 [Gemmatimonadota bacterium]|jgi:hypothetical protein